MRRNTEEKKTIDEQAISDDEAWLTIRYLDPDREAKASKIAVISTIFAICSIIFTVCILLHLRGL